MKPPTKGRIKKGVYAGIFGFVVLAGALYYATKEPEVTDPHVLALMTHELVNEERAKAGVPALQWRDDLAEVARAHAISQIGFNDLKHSTTYCMGENAAKSENGLEPFQAVDWWMDSPAHRQNLLNAAFVVEGIGVAKSGSEIIYIQNFC